MECLLWRGFLAELKDGTAWLLRGSHDDDIHLLEQCGLECQVINDPECIYLAEIQAPENPDVLRNVFFSQEQNGMVGAPDGDEEHLGIDENFESFRQRHGDKVATRHLDPGIALLIKVLPSCGVFTVMSCQGHNDVDGPKIWVRSQWDSSWFVCILERLWLDLEESRLEANFKQFLPAQALQQTINGNDVCRPYFFSLGGGQPDWRRYEFCYIGLDEGELEQFSLIQKLARRLMIRANEFMAEKVNLLNEDGLINCANRDNWQAWARMVLTKFQMPHEPESVNNFLRPILADQVRDLV